MAVAFAVIFLASPAFAGGSKEVVQGTVEGLENWQTVFDVSGMKPGVYNFLVEGSDAAGNSTVAGPFNVRIDPETDLPRVSISYPSSGTRIGGRLVVVGTCDDDDAVERVEWHIDGGQWSEAEGKDFWAISMDAGALTDGTYHIGVRGIDVNGTPGHEITVPLVFDSSIPYMEVDSRQSGALAAGRVGLDGRALDANGTDSLEVSLDGGETYITVKTSGKKDADARFSYTLDSKRLADGPFVVWFRVTDKAGSVGYSPFLLLVDNTPPRIELFSPAGDESVNGNFVAVGAVRDDVGLASLEWSLGDAAGTIALEAGNPYWVLPLAVPGGKKPSKARLQLKATDVAGNVTTLNVNLSVDPLADLPLVHVDSPATGAVLEGAFILTGTVRDDDGAAALWYRLDDGEPVRVPAIGAFSTSVPVSGVGKRSLSVWAEDTLGLVGLPTVLPLVQAGEPVRIGLELVSVSGPNKTTVDGPFVTGMELAPDSGAVLRGSASGGGRIVSLSYAWAGAAPLALAVPKGAGPVSFSVPLPRDGPWGSVELEILAKDVHGREASFRSLVYLTNYARTRGDPLVRFDDPLPGPDGLRLIGPDRPLVGSFSGGILAKVELEPASDYLSISSDQDRIVVRAIGEGPPARHRVTVGTEKGHVFQSEELYLGTDLTAPTLEIQALPAFVGQVLELAGIARDASGMASLRTRLRDQSGWNDIEVSGDADQEEFAFELPLDGVADGPVFIEFEAADSAGQTSLKLLATVKDTTPPAFRAITPVPSEAGAYRVAGFVRDTGGVASAEGPDGILQVAADGFISLMIADELSGKPVLKVADRAGNSAELDLPWHGIAINQELAVPEEPAIAQQTDDSSSGVVAGSTAEAAAESPDETVAETATEPTTESVADTAAEPESTAESVSLPATTPAASPATTQKSKNPPKPELILLWPPAGEVLDGDYTAVVQARSTDPLASLGWSGGGSTGILNPAEGSIHIIRVPAVAPGARKLSISVSAKTTAGGSASLSIPLATDSAKAVPQLLVDVSGGPSQAPVVFISATSATGVGGFTLAIDGSEPKLIESSGAVVLDLPGLSLGSRALVVSSQGLAGRGSASLKSSVTVLGIGPRIRVDALVGKDGRRDFFGAGAMVLPVDARLTGTVEAPNDLASLSLVFTGVDPVKLSPKKIAAGSFTFEAVLPRNLPPELLEFVIVAVDKAGNEDSYSGSLYRVFPAPSAGLNDDEGLRFNDERFAGSAGGATRVLLFDDNPVIGRFVGRPLESLELDTQNPVVSVSFDGSQIRLIPGDEGITEPLTMIARTIDGDEFTWGPFIALRDRGLPELKVLAPQTDAWVQDRVAIEVSASDPNGISAVEVSSDASSWTPLMPAVAGAEPEGESSGGSAPANEAPAEDAPDERPANETPAEDALAEGAPIYQADLDLGLIPEGGVFLTVRATDGAGRVSESVVSISRDVTAPAIRLSAPATGDSPNGRTTVAALVSDAGSLALLELALAGGPFQPVDLGTAISAVAELTGEPEAPPPVAFRATDRSGNVTELVPAFEIDPAADLPRAVIQAPREAELVRSDFSVSGVVFDDDGAAAAYYRLDEGEWTRVELQGSSFSIPFTMEQVGDNEHVVQMYGEDLYGVTGETAEVRFRISTAEPTGFMAAPSLEDTVRGVVMLTGEASDENGISEVHVSFDNAVSFHRADGTGNWSYPLDTRILSDGTRSIIIRTLDGYGVEGISAGIMTADNVPPTVAMDVPGDGEDIFRTLPISGRVGDTTAIEEVYAELLGVGSSDPVRRMGLGDSAVVQAEMDVNGLPAGNYILRLCTRDRAANETFVTRELVIHDARPGLSLDIRLPVSGEKVTGNLLVAGRFTGVKYPATVTILADGVEIDSTEADNTGYYFTTVAEERLPADGPLVLTARAFDPEGNPVLSRGIPLEWAKTGPWAMVDSLGFGDFTPYRPFLSGRAGWIGELPSDPKEAKAVLKSRTPASVEVSMDDGRSFTPARGGQEWRFRLETQDYPEGGLFPIVRVRYNDDSVAVVRTVLGLDKTLPRVEVLDPAEGALFDNVVSVNGTAWDDHGLEDLSVYLRAGDKAGYELPSFLQGLYLDGHAFGGSYWEFGLGLTFFDDAVKLQGQLGKAASLGDPTMDIRFGGSSYGIKLLASLARLPFGFLFGPDWDFLSAEAMVGANFAFFSESRSGSGLMLAAVVAQLEFPRVTLKDLSIFRTYSFYTEGTFWLFSSDVEAKVQPALAMGIRIGVF
ncbi:MAG: Ig-like domain-containing protein [Spirochaetota bacterium]